MGPKGKITEARAELGAAVAEAHSKYLAMNAGRNPLKNVEPYLLPMAVALSAYLCRWFVNMSCSHSACTNASDFFAHLYVVCVTLIVIASAGNIRAVFDHCKQLAPLILGASPTAKPKTS